MTQARNHRAWEARKFILPYNCLLHRAFNINNYTLRVSANRIFLNVARHSAVSGNRGIFLSVHRNTEGGGGFADKLLAVPFRLYTKDITLSKKVEKFGRELVQNHIWLPDSLKMT